MHLRCLTLLLLSALSSVAAERPLSVSFMELVKHTRKYDGRRVSVRAYALTSLYECSQFWASREAARKGHISGYVNDSMAIGRVKRGYALPKWFAMRLFKVPPHTEGYDGYVHVVGTFRYIDLTPAPTPKPKKIAEVPRGPNGEVEREIVMMRVGFGQWGLYDKTITDMTECTPIGPPLPSGLKQ
jgi:hypothetical protein